MFLKKSANSRERKLPAGSLEKTFSSPYESKPINVGAWCKCEMHMTLIGCQFSLQDQPFAPHNGLFSKGIISRMSTAAAACSLSPQSAFIEFAPSREDECRNF
jgi:hypothetical protein